MPRLSQASRKCKVESVKSKNIITSLLSLLIIISSLFTLALTFPAPSLAQALDPKKACFNPEPAYIKDINGNYVLDANGQKAENLTDNYITDDKGDPIGPEGVNNLEALKFTFIHTGKIGDVPGDNGTAVLTKTMTFKADFSKLQAIFGAPTSDYLEGKYQEQTHAQANLLDLKNPALIQKHQGPEGKTAPTAITNDLRQKYVNYVIAKPSPGLAESDIQFSDYNGANKKKISELVTTYGLPTPPGPSDDRTDWISKWGKYWENIPTTYNEFYIGKLEFRELHGTFPDPDNPGKRMPLIKAVKQGVLGSCNKFNPVRIVEFPVPNFFRSAATSGVLNQVILPKSAWSDQNDLFHVQGAVLGIKTSASDFIKNCFKFASNNPVTNIIKKVIKVSMQKLDQQYSVYAAVGASNLNTSNEVCAGTQVNIKFNWTPQADNVWWVTGAQWLDLSTNAADPFGTTGGVNNYINQNVLGANSYSTTSGGSIGPLDANKTHYWRINTQNALNGAWSPSATGTFTTKDCAAPPVVLGATNLSTANEACVNINQVNITFNWTPQPNGAFFTTGAQWLDLSTNAADPFGRDPVTGNNNYINHDVFGANSYSTTTVPGNIGPLDANKTHFWRINTLNSLNNTWYPSATGTFTTKDCRPKLDSPTINYTKTVNGTQVTFTFQPAAANNFGLVIFDNPQIPGKLPVFDSLTIPSGNSVTWNNAQFGSWTAVLIQGLSEYSNRVNFDVPYHLFDPPTFGPKGKVIFDWTPPSNGNISIYVVKNPDDHIFNWDSRQLDTGKTTTFGTFQSGNYTACVFYAFGCISNLVDFTVDNRYLWEVFDLSNTSCIKVGKQGKAGNAPFCAIYPNKFEPAVKGDRNVFPGECKEDSKSFFKLNDQTNVVCTFTFEWRSSNYNTDPNKSLVIPATGNGNWDECDDPPPGSTNRTCRLTVGVWPDFRVPYLGQIWNNSLYSDTNEYLPTKQVTGQPGVYAILQPKAVSEELAKDPIQIMIDKCEADPTRSITGGCKDLVDWGATHSTAYPGFGDCVGATLLDPTHARLVACFDLVAHSIIGKNLPGEVNPSVAGVNTGTGSVLGTSDSNQKERLIGAVDCGKHFSRDIALKPKVLQQSLGIQQDCNLTASALPPGSTPGTPPDTRPGSGCDGGTAFSALLPNPIPVSAGAQSTSILGRIGSPLLDAAKYGAAKSGIPCELLIGLHYVEASWDENGSFISGRTTGTPEPDVPSVSACTSYGGSWTAGGCVFANLQDTAYYAGDHIKDKMAALGQGWNPPANFNDMIGAMSYYNGGGNSNCGEGVPYNSPCPPPTGIDDPYAVSHFDSLHAQMYLIYCADLTRCDPPQPFARDGAATAAKEFYLK